MTRTILTLLSACAVCIAAVAGPPPLYRLIGDLAGPDPVKRSLARQWLPRHGIDAVPELVPLFASEDQHAWRAAENALHDIANQFAESGDEAGLSTIAEAIVPLTGPDRPERVRWRSLDLLKICTPEGYGVAAIAALLRDEDIRERARATLQIIDTTEARTAIASAAQQESDPAFKTALLRSLAESVASEGIDVAVAACDHTDPGVRAVAAQAVAVHGIAGHLALLERVRTQANAATRFEATDAMLRFADALTARGGHLAIARAIHRHVLKESKNPVLRNAAVAGLGRYGDETVVADIVTAANNDPLLIPGAAEAVRQLEGRAAFDALLGPDGYMAASARLKPRLLRAYGETREPMFATVLNEAATSDAPTIQWAALDALTALGDPAAVPGLTTLATEDAYHARAVAALENIADRMAQEQRAGDAGRAYLALYETTTDASVRRAALEGLKQFPVPEAFEVIMDAVGGADLGSLSAPMVAGLAKALHDAGRDDEAAEAVAVLKEQIDSTEAVYATLDLARAMPGTFSYGFIDAWAMIGPFHWNQDTGFQAPPFDPANIDFEIEHAWNEKPITWRRETNPDPAAMFELTGRFGMINNVAMYAFARVRVDETQDVTVRSGSDDGIRIWVNGEVVHANPTDRGAAIDQDRANATLRAGESDLLVQVTQNGGGWGFCVRLTRPDGFPLEFDLVPVLATEG